MAAAEYVVRCPYCLREKHVPKDISVEQVLHCDRCDKRYEFQNSLPGREDDVQVAVRDLATTSHEQRISRVLFLGLPVACLLAWSLSAYSHGLNGPTFLVLYFFSGIGSLFISSLVRWNYVDTFYVSSTAAIFYVLLGILRYIDASAQGMSNFGFMVTFMFIGFFLFFIRSEQEGGKRKTTFFGSCGGGCGSSCGGGCGGGCGGCGG
jgi:hypothetical protein